MIFQFIKDCLAHGRFFLANKWFKCLPEHYVVGIAQTNLPFAASPSALCDSDKEGEEKSLMVHTSSKYSSKSRAQHLLLFIVFHVFFTKKPRGLDCFYMGKEEKSEEERAKE